MTIVIQVCRRMKLLKGGEEMEERACTRSQSSVIMQVRVQQMEVRQQETGYLGGGVASGSEDEPSRRELAPLLQEVDHLPILYRATQAEVRCLDMTQLHTTNDFHEKL
jgi:hypothetical protein